MLNLNNREWKNFLIKDIFITERKGNNILQVPTGSNVKKSELKRGNIPRITVTSQNNGIYDFYQPNNVARLYENFISVSFLGTIFYHPYIASLDMKVHCLKLIDRNLNKYLAKFIISALNQNLLQYSYGNQLSSTDLPRKKYCCLLIFRVILIMILWNSTSKNTRNN